MFDGKAFGREIVDVVKTHVASVVEPINQRLDAIERRFDELPAAMTADDAGVVILAEVRKATDTIPAQIEEAVAAKVAELPPPPELPDVPAMVAEAVAAIPAPQDGKDADPEQVAALVAEQVEKAVSALPAPKDGEPGRDGKDADEELIFQMLCERVDEKIAAIPLPKDGKDGADGKDGRDGLDAVSFIRDEGGGLVVIMSDGTTRDLGRIVGESGKDGRDGRDGRDGFGFEDLDLIETDKGLALRFERGEDSKEFHLPVVIDRGIWREGESYAKGAGVTWGGSFWIAQEDTSEKPDSGNGWRLAVKRGRDGKDGVVKEAPKPEPVRVGKPKGDK